MSIELRRIAFRNGDRRLAGHLRLPSEFTEQKSYPSVVVVGPGSSVKEQAAANYAERLSRRGYVTLTFDPSFQGESEGSPRDAELPATRVEDIRCAADFLVTQPFIDEEAIGLLGLCAGGGYTIAAAMIERRFKAVGTVVANDLGTAFRRMSPKASAVEDLLEAVARQRTAEARGAAQKRQEWLPSAEQARALRMTDPGLLNAIDYYLTPRGHQPTRTNKRLLTSDAAIIGFDGFHLVEELLVQPLQVIVGGKLGTTFSHEAGKSLWERARNRRDFVVIEGADHYDLYDRPEYVDPAVEALAALYDMHLVAGANAAPPRAN